MSQSNRETAPPHASCPIFSTAVAFPANETVPLADSENVQHVGIQIHICTATSRCVSLDHPLASMNLVSD